MKTIKIFVSYAHEDALLQQELKKQLSILQHQGYIDIWYDRDIKAGMEWEKEINDHLNSAQILLLLISADFLASEYCYSVEMQRAIERHNRKEALVIPIILRPVRWQEAPFGKLQVLPSNGKPVTSGNWHTLDDALFDVAEGIRKALKALSPELVLKKPQNVQDRPINHVLILMEDSGLGRLLEGGLKRTDFVQQVTWMGDIENAFSKARIQFEYDAIYLDVRSNWARAREFLLMIRHQYPMVPFVLVGDRKTFLQGIEEKDRQRFSHYFFLESEIPLSQAPQSLLETLGAILWDLKTS